MVLAKVSAEREPTRERLVREARRILESDGYAALTVRGVARALKLSTAAPYKHFEDGFPEMLARIAQEGFQELIEAMERVRSAGPRERVVDVGLAYVRFGVERPDLYRAMFSAHMAGRIELHDDLLKAGNITSKSREVYARLHAVKVEAFTALVVPLEEAQCERVLKNGNPQEFGLAMAALLHGLVGEFIDE